jgi:hypothetical protein
MNTGIEEEDKSKESSDSDNKEEKEDKSSKKEEEDTSDDNSSEEDNEEEDSEEEDSEELDDEDITKMALTNPNKLPKKLRGYAKKLQAVFTRRMQEASSSVTKAKAFERLAANPEFLEWVEEQKNGGSKKSKSRASEDDSDDDSDDEDSPLTMKALDKILDKKLSKLTESISAKEQADLDKEQRIEANKFKKDYPDWHLYKDSIIELMDDNPRLSYVQAYKLAKDEAEENEDGVKGKSKKMEDKKKANSNKPNRMGASDSDGKKKVKGVKGAFLLAKEMLAQR